MLHAEPGPHSPRGCEVFLPAVLLWSSKNLLSLLCLLWMNRVRSRSLYRAIFLLTSIIYSGILSTIQVKDVLHMYILIFPHRSCCSSKCANPSRHLRRHPSPCPLSPHPTHA